MAKYKIYHIPDYVYKNGNVGKVGLTEQELDRRMQANLKKSLKPFTFWELLEEHDDKYTASMRELELQREYDYEVDDIPYHKSVRKEKVQSKGGKAQSLEDKLKGFNKVTSEQKSKAGKIGGKIRAAQMTFEELSYAGKVGGKKASENLDTFMGGYLTCIHCNKTMNKGNFKRWHGDKCKEVV